MKKNVSEIDNRHAHLKQHMDSQFKKNTKEKFHYKLEKSFSKINALIEAGKSQPQEVRRRSGGCRIL